MALSRAYRPGSPRLLRKPPAISGIVLLAYLAVFCLLCSVAKYCLASFLASLRYYHPARPHRELVVAAMSRDNTSWLHEYLPDWGRKVYVVDDPDAPLTVPSNKGREAMVYLTYAVVSSTLPRGGRGNKFPLRLPLNPPAFSSNLPINPEY